MRLQPRLLLLASVLALLSFASFAQAQPPGGTIYAHDETYRTVATPADLPNAGNFDTIYVLGNDLANVADAAPGDRDFNGGRWEVRPIEWKTITPTQFTNAEQVRMAAENGEIEIGDVIRRFECPLIPDRRR